MKTLVIYSFYHAPQYNLLKVHDNMNIHVWAMKILIRIMLHTLNQYIGMK